MQRAWTCLWFCVGVPARACGLAGWEGGNTCGHIHVMTIGSLFKNAPTTDEQRRRVISSDGPERPTRHRAPQPHVGHAGACLVHPSIHASALACCLELFLSTARRENTAEGRRFLARPFELRLSGAVGLGSDTARRRRSRERAKGKDEARGTRHKARGGWVLDQGPSSLASIDRPHAAINQSTNRSIG